MARRSRTCPSRALDAGRRRAGVFSVVGTTLGAKDLVSSGEIQGNLVRDAEPAARPAYVRVWVKVAGVWRSTDSTFTVPPLSYITYPTNGSTVADMSQPLRWTAVAGAQAYTLYVGTIPGAKDLASSGEIQATSFPMPHLPPGIAYARVWVKAAGVWRSTDSSFTVHTLAYVTYPNDGSAVTDLSPPVR